jgi:FkbM family methyltransferase
MNFDNPAWRASPLRTGARVAKSLARRAVPRLSRLPVPYDVGRSSIMADLNTPMGLTLYRYGISDPDAHLAGQLLAPGDVFVDGGANIGLFTLVGARRVGARGKVLAFEPGRSIRLRLMENVALNGLAQVEVIPFALSAGPGEAAFRTFDVGGAGLNHLAPADGEGGDIETVALVALDDVIIPSDRARVTLLKLDLEGGEHAALRGAAATLQQARPDILIEIGDAYLRRMGSSAAEVGALLRAHGYQFFRPGDVTEGAPTVTPLSDLTIAGIRPNVFATTNPARARERGVRFVDC